MACACGMAALLASLVGCKSSSQSRPVQAETNLVVYAAASLRDAFTDLSDVYRRTHPGVTVTFNFAGSQELRTQIEHGAGADVFASADSRNMNPLVAAGRVQPPVIFARNNLVVVVTPEKQAAVQSLEKLPTVDRIVLGALEVPVGKYTEQMLELASRRYGRDFKSRVDARVVSRELNVRQVLAKVILGEADAGVVYRTDASSQPGRVSVVAIEPELNVIAEYPIAVVNETHKEHLSAQWVSLVRSPTGRKALAAHGFDPAPGEATQ